MQNSGELSTMNAMNVQPFSNLQQQQAPLPLNNLNVPQQQQGQMPNMNMLNQMGSQQTQQLQQQQMNLNIPPVQGGQGQPPVPVVQPPPTEGTQQFCLRWNSYPATVATQLAALRDAQDFVDVTLACDNRHLRAHKLVLSACSPYFMQLFKSTPCQHPVIFLHDVGFRQLVALLEFMYAGEVNVSQAELPALLRTAEALQVRGLADTTANNNNNNTTSCPQMSKTDFAPQYGQPVMNHNQNLGGNHNTSIPMTEVPLPEQQPPMPPTSSNAPTLPSSNSIDSTHSQMSGKRVQQNSTDSKAKDEESEDESNEFEMIESLEDENKNETYMTEGNLTTGLDNTGEIFPDDPSFDMGDGELGNDLGMENQSDGEEESSEDGEASDDDGECKEFTYQSDASYSQEGPDMANGESLAGPSGLSKSSGGSGGPEEMKHSSGGLPGGGGSGRNRLSRSLWPPGIPYHGPQQCPYCPRKLSNVGNWRKHVLTMHFAREKNYKCCHCTSSFRTAEYLQKHYVRVHNYPQKMTRRKYEGSGSTPNNTVIKPDALNPHQ